MPTTKSPASTPASPPPANASAAPPPLPQQAWKGGDYNAFDPRTPEDFLQAENEKRAAKAAAEAVAADEKEAVAWYRRIHWWDLNKDKKKRWGLFGWLLRKLARALAEALRGKPKTPAEKAAAAAEAKAVADRIAAAKAAEKAAKQGVKDTLAAEKAAQKKYKDAAKEARNATGSAEEIAAAKQEEAYAAEALKNATTARKAAQAKLTEAATARSLAAEQIAERWSFGKAVKGMFRRAAMAPVNLARAIVMFPIKLAWGIVTAPFKFAWKMVTAPFRFAWKVVSAPFRLMWGAAKFAKATVMASYHTLSFLIDFPGRTTALAAKLPGMVGRAALNAPAALARTTAGVARGIAMAPFNLTGAVVKGGIWSAVFAVGADYGARRLAGANQEQAVAGLGHDIVGVYHAAAVTGIKSSATFRRQAAITNAHFHNLLGNLEHGELRTALSDSWDLTKSTLRAADSGIGFLSGGATVEGTVSWAWTHKQGTVDIVSGWASSAWNWGTRAESWQQVGHVAGQVLQGAAIIVQDIPGLAKQAYNWATSADGKQTMVSTVSAVADLAKGGFNAVLDFVSQKDVQDKALGVAGGFAKGVYNAATTENLIKAAEGTASALKGAFSWTYDEVAGIANAPATREAAGAAKDFVVRNVTSFWDSLTAPKAADPLAPHKLNHSALKQPPANGNATSFVLPKVPHQTPANDPEGLGYGTAS